MSSVEKKSVAQVLDRPVRAAAKKARCFNEAISRYEQSNEELSD